MKTIIRVLKAMMLVLLFMLAVVLGIWVFVSVIEYCPVILLILFFIGTVYVVYKELKEAGK